MKKSIAVLLFLLPIFIGVLTNLITPDFQDLYNNYRFLFWFIYAVSICVGVILIRIDSSQSVPSWQEAIHQQDEEVRRFADYSAIFEVELRKSAENVGSYSKELGVIYDTKDKYSEEELRSRIIRWIDKIENEIEYASSKTRELNNRGRAAVQSIRQDANNLKRSLQHASNIDRHQILHFVRLQEQYLQHMLSSLKNINTLIPNLRSAFAGENQPRRLRIVTDSLTRELEDLAQIISEGTTIVEEVIRTARSKA